MTTQYITGELSLLLGELQGMAANQRLARDVGRLRAEAEAAPFGALPVIALRAVDLMRRLCSDALDRGDVSDLCRQAAWGAELMQFVRCANLLEEGEGQQLVRYSNVPCCAGGEDISAARGHEQESVDGD